MFVFTGHESAELFSNGSQFVILERESMESNAHGSLWAAMRLDAQTSGVAGGELQVVGIMTQHSNWVSRCLTAMVLSISAISPSATVNS